MFSTVKSNKKEKRLTNEKREVKIIEIAKNNFLLLCNCLKTKEIGKLKQVCTEDFLKEIENLSFEDNRLNGLSYNIVHMNENELTLDIFVPGEILFINRVFFQIKNNKPLINGVQ
jgi:hypothetical protein